MENKKKYLLRYLLLMTHHHIQIGLQHLELLKGLRIELGNKIWLAHHGFGHYRYHTVPDWDIDISSASGSSE